ncbi:MAG: CHAD domain-containing protein [Lentimicrobium sp.]|nr:CHAD domain-containing protein [Lentimicrobium sp.]
MNFNLAQKKFDADAIHDMRVAFKRIRAVYLLMERLFPEHFDMEEAEGVLKELFRLSGRMRDAQVQQTLLEVHETNLSTTFGEYNEYLKKTEKKSIKKFREYLHKSDAESELKKKQQHTGQLISTAEDEQIRQQIILFVHELMDTAHNMHTEQEKDENLHEIRRKLKQCHYLLSVFDPNDAGLPEINTRIKRLDKANDLLGAWHDHLVAMEMLDRFLDKVRQKDLPGMNRYTLLRENLAEERHLLHMKILKYLGEKLDF